MASVTVPDLRGKMFRSNRLMPDKETREFQRKQKIAHVGTVDRKGWPYVVPLVYVYEDGDYLYLHTGAHQGHFLTNLQRDSRTCIEVSDVGPLHKGKRFACDSALVYTSVVVFVPVRILYHDREKKEWFLDRLLAKHGDLEGVTFVMDCCDTRQLAWRRRCQEHGICNSRALYQCERHRMRGRVPVDCIHPRKNEDDFAASSQLYIDPVECIDCGACVPICPVSAIVALEDLPEKWKHYAEMNAEHYAHK